MIMTRYERNLRLQIHLDSLTHTPPRASCHEHVQEQNLMIITHHDVYGRNLGFLWT